MNVRVTSISWREVGDSIRSVTADLEKALSGLFKDLSFGAGVDQLTIVVISVSSEDSENDKLCRGYNKIGRLQNPVTKKSTKSIGVAIPLNSCVISKISRSELRKLLCESVLHKVANPDLRVPKDFDYKEFSERLSTAIAIFSRAS